MAANRTREIGIRKVMGANSAQIVRMLLWQFSTPVFWGLLVAVPVSYLASETYLNFFADRIGQPAVVVLTAGVAALGFSWLVVVLHAYRVASVNPIRSLRYE
jgi:putative ABC transport system permease protein